MATPIIQSTGSSSGAGTAGQGRNSLVIGETVTLSDTEASNVGASYVWAFEDIPIGSSTALTGAATSTPTFNPDVSGSYRILCTVGGTASSVEVLAVPLPFTGARIPSFEEGIEYDGSGNAKGWHAALDAFMRSVDSGLAPNKQGNQYSDVDDLTDAASVAYAASASNIFSLLATAGVGATRELANPTGLVVGMTWQVWFTHDVTGGRELTFGTNYDFGDEGAPSFAAQAGSITSIITCVAIGASTIAATVLKGFGA